MGWLGCLPWLLSLIGMVVVSCLVTVVIVLIIFRIGLLVVNLCRTWLMTVR